MGTLTPTCLHCGIPLASTRRSYCCDAHKLRAFRRRRAGLRQNNYVDGGRRGRVGLGELTLAEQVAAVVSARPR